MRSLQDFVSSISTKLRRDRDSSSDPRGWTKGPAYPKPTETELEDWIDNVDSDPDLMYAIPGFKLGNLEENYILLTESGWIFPEAGIVCFRSALHRLGFNKFLSYSDRPLIRPIVIQMSDWHPSDHDFVLHSGCGFITGTPLLALNFHSPRDMVLFQAYLVSAVREEALRTETLIPLDVPAGMPMPLDLWRLYDPVTMSHIPVQVRGAIMSNRVPYVVFRAKGRVLLEAMPFDDWRLCAVPERTRAFAATHCAE
jgi:hypothetical protein